MSADQYEAVHKKDRKDIMKDNFLGGLAWGIGSIIGATIIIGVLGILITTTRQVPFVGEITNIIIDQVEKGQKTFDTIPK